MKRLKQVCWQGLKAPAGYIRVVLQDTFSNRAELKQMQREKVHLLYRLAKLRADYNQLKQDMDELLRYADKELGELRRTNSGLAKEFDELQLRVLELEQQVEELLNYIAKLAQANEPDEDVMEAVPDLAHVMLGIVGGHVATQREVINELNLIYGLQRWVVVPPTWESSLKKSVLKQKLERCDLIVIITGYMNHSLTDAVLGLNSSGALAGKVVLLNLRGKSGVVREILRQVASLG